MQDYEDWLAEYDEPMTDDKMDDMFAQSTYSTLLLSREPERLLQDVRDYFAVGLNGDFEKHPPMGYDVKLPDDMLEALREDGLPEPIVTDDPLGKIKENLMERLSVCAPYMKLELIQMSLDCQDKELCDMVDDAVLTYYESSDGLPFDKYVNYISMNVMDYNNNTCDIIASKIDYERSQGVEDLDVRLGKVLHPETREDFENMFDGEQQILMRIGDRLSSKLMRAEEGQVLGGVDITKDVEVSSSEIEKQTEKQNVDEKSKFVVPEFSEVSDAYGDFGS